MNAFVIQTLPGLLLGLLFKSVCLLLAAWAACSLMRRSSAAARHLVWSAALGGVLLLPLLMVSLPHWNMALQHAPAVVAPPSAPPPTAAPVQATPAPTSAAYSTTQAMPLPSPAVSTPRPPRPMRTVIIWPVVGVVTSFGLWFLGVIAILVRLADGLRRVGTIRRRAIPLDAATLALAESLRGRLGVRRPVAFRRAASGSGISVPLTWGGLFPTVLLPAQSFTWREDALRAALLHELAHVARWDWTTQTIGRLACALYWVNPLVWIAARDARAESERACDDCVLGAGFSAAEYAQRLVDVVRSMPDAAPIRTVAIAMAQPSEIESRLWALLAKGRSHRPLTRRLALGTLAVLALLALPLAALRLTAQAQTALTMADAVQPVPGGGTARLVGVSTYPSGPGTWWGKDGVRLSEAPGWSADHSLKMGKPSQGQTLREFVLDVRGMAPGGDLTVDVPSSLSEGTASTTSSHDTHVGFIGAFPRAQQTCTVRLGVAVRPWQTLASHTALFDAGESSISGRRPDAGAYTALFSRPSAIEGKLSFTVTYSVNSPPPHRGMERVVAIDARGRTVLPESGGIVGSAGLQQRTITFPTLALKNIKELQLQWRPYEWIEFKNVPLQPTATPASVQAPVVMLAGISTYPPAARTWWSKDGIRLTHPPAGERALSPSTIHLQMGLKAREFVINVHGARHDGRPPIDPLDFWMDPPSKNILVYDSRRAPDGGFSLGIVNALPVAQTTATFRVGVPTEPWQTLGTVALTDNNEDTTLSGSSAELGNYALRLSPLTTTGSETTLTWTDTITHQPGRDHTFRFIAVDAQGRLFPGFSRRGKRVDGVWQHVIAFPTPAHIDIKAIQVQMRPYVWTVFKDVPLQPVGADASFGPPAPGQLPPVFVGFRRYVSRPTPDGMRYTFLYPAYLTKISVEKPNTKGLTYEDIGLFPSRTSVSWMPARGGTPVTHPAPATASAPPTAGLIDFISVVVGQTYPRPVFGGTPPRRDRQWVAAGRSHHDIALTDPRTQRRFWLNHDAYDDPALFRQTDPVIASSFRLLPPGALLPATAQPKP